jgi:AhpC/TSA family
MVSLSDYRGSSSVLLALFRGLWCPFCRRAIVQMGVLHDNKGGTTEGPPKNPNAEGTGDCENGLDCVTRLRDTKSSR